MSDENIKPEIDPEKGVEIDFLDFMIRINKRIEKLEQRLEENEKKYDLTDTIAESTAIGADILLQRVEKIEQNSLKFEALVEATSYGNEKLNRRIKKLEDKVKDKEDTVELKIEPEYDPEDTIIGVYTQCPKCGFTVTNYFKEGKNLKKEIAGKLDEILEHTYLGKEIDLDHIEAEIDELIKELEDDND